MFTVALSGYCRQLSGDHETVIVQWCWKRSLAINAVQNQMRDAMRAFEKLASVVTLPIVLLFTKTDVFRKNLRVYCFSDFFPEYTGRMDSISIRAYFASEFRRLDRRPGRRLFITFLNATNPDAFKKVFDQIESHVLQPLPKSPVPDRYQNSGSESMITPFEQVSVNAMIMAPSPMPCRKDNPGKPLPPRPPWLETQSLYS